MPGTTIPALTVPQFTVRLASMYPRGWAGDDGKQTGNFAHLLGALSSQLQVVLQQVSYTLGATLLTTATYPELDYKSADLFGNQLPRPPGMTDAAFASLIQARLFQSAATRSAISTAIQQVTGTAPRIMETWNERDSGSWNTFSYWDVDTKANPSRWAAPEYRATAFIETLPNTYSTPNKQPLITFDDGTYWDIAGGQWTDTQYGNALSLFAVIESRRAAGVTLWVRFVASIT